MDRLRPYRTAALDDPGRFRYQFSDQFRHDEDRSRLPSQSDSLLTAALLLFLSAALAISASGAGPGVELILQVGLALWAAAGALAFLWGGLRSAGGAGQSETGDVRRRGSRAA